MRKAIFAAVAVLISLGAFAQKLKVEDGEIKLDDKTVALIEGKKPLFKISNLEKSYTVDVELKYLADSGFGKRWMVVKSVVTGKTNEVDYKKFSPQNQEKSAVQAFLDQNFLTVAGLDSAAIETYINGESTGVSKKIMDEQGEIAKEKAYLDSFQVNIDDAGTIYSLIAKNADPKDKRIGYVKMVSPSTNGELAYEIRDLDNFLVAVWYAKNGSQPGYNQTFNEEVLTFDKKILPAKFDKSGNSIGYNMSKDKTPINIVKALVTNGYVLQHQAAAKIEEMTAERVVAYENKVTDEKNASKNFYEQNGYVIDEKGEKREGPITAEFEGIKAESSSGIADMTAYGKTVILKYTNAKGRGKLEVFKSKNNIRFCIDNAGKEDCYLGLKTIGNTMAAAGSLNSLSLDFSSFYKVLYENEGCMVLVDPLEPSDFVIKIPSQEKGLYTNKSSSDKLKKNATSYLECDSFVFENYDFKTLEGLTKVVEDYKSSCAK